MNGRQVDDLIREAVKKEDVAALAAATDHLRFTLGLNYRQTFERAQLVVPELELPEWDQLLAKLDEAADHGVQPDPHVRELLRSAAEAEEHFTLDELEAYAAGRGRGR